MSWLSSHLKPWHLFSFWPGVEWYLYRKSIGLLWWLLKGRNKMKTLVSLEGGAVQIQEQAGDFYMVFDGELGGGAVKGIIEGKGSIKLGAGSVGLKLAEAFINAHLPASVVPFAAAAEQYLNGVVAGA